MNPNFLLNMPKLPNVMAEDCNVPALRNIRPFDTLRKAVRVRRSRVTREQNEAFLRMLAGR